MSQNKAIGPSVKTTKPLAFDAVIFDIDNVLIDTRHSYLDAIRWTIEIFLTHGKVPYFKPTQRAGKPSILSADDVDQFKLLGGFNDDWDCCYGLLIYLLKLPIQAWTTDNLKKAINIKGFSKQVTKRPLRVSGIVEKFGVVRGVTIEKISRIFQEVYLGKKLFPLLERKRLFYWKKRGLIDKEKLIFKRPLLEKLKERGVKLGIATGRPRFEALYALRHFGILDLFDVITSITEVKKAEQLAKESLRKPHPYSLIETGKKIGAKKRFLYVGDLPDDTLAAERAKSTLNIRAAAFPWFSSNPARALQEIQKTHPDFLLRKPSGLISLVEASRH